jgi:dolichyl-phosphate-mannose-protein mannosyltransferase
MFDRSRLKSSVGQWSIPVALFLGSLVFVGATLKDYGITWDEPPYFHAADLHIAWITEFFSNVSNGNIQQSLSDAKIKFAWHWNPYNVPHPPFSRIVSGWTRLIFTSRLDSFSAYRMGPALFFAALVTIMYLWTNELFGRAAGLFSALALVCTPNLFGFAHIAVTDLPLATMWFLTSYCFWKGLDDSRWSVALGIAWGFALATKFPALLIPLPLILWAHLFYRHKYVNNVFAMVFLAPVVMIAIQPYLWHQVGMRFVEFLFEGVSRGYRPDANFPVLFFGTLYYTNQLPWYYPFFLLGVTTPEPILVLALLGAGSIHRLREQRPAIMFFLLNALFVPLMGLLPGAVLHDGVRQLLSGIPFLVGLAGGGFHILVRFVKAQAMKIQGAKNINHIQSKIVGSGFVLLLFPAALDLFIYHPFELSYYNRLIGGTRGAYEKGLEVTYFLEAFNPEFLRYLNDKLPLKAVVNASFGNFMFQYYQNEHRLRPDIQITDKQSVDYYILLSRRSVWSKKEWRLSTTNSPIAAVRLGGVPLVSVYRLPASLPRK